MKVLTCSRHFPKGHPKAGQPTYFVEKILRDLSIPNYWAEFQEWNKEKPMEILHEFSRTFYYPVQGNKHHTIRAGSRWKVGDMISLRVWSDKPYRSKQIEFAQVEVKKVWNIEISEFWWINDCILEHGQVAALAKNDGLTYEDFVAWFKIHPKKKDETFTGQIICWSSAIEYTPSTLTEKMEG
jgi:hypothetical protein